MGATTGGFVAGWLVGPGEGLEGIGDFGPGGGCVPSKTIGGSSEAADTCVGCGTVVPDSGSTLGLEVSHTVPPAIANKATVAKTMSKPLLGLAWLVASGLGSAKPGRSIRVAPAAGACRSDAADRDVVVCTGTTATGEIVGSETSGRACKNSSALPKRSAGSFDSARITAFTTGSGM